MNKLRLHLWIIGVFGVLMSGAVGVAEDIDPRLAQVLADWQKRQNAFRSVRYEVRGERRILKGAYNANEWVYSQVPGLRRDQPIPSQDLAGTLSLTLLLDFEKGRHRCKIQEPIYHAKSGEFSSREREDTFDGSVAKGIAPREKNPGLGKTQPDSWIVSGNMKNGEFNANYYPIFFGHGRIHTVFEPIIPGQLRNKPDPDYLYVHGTGVHVGRTCLIVRTQTLKSATTSFDEYWVDTDRESAILRYVSYCDAKPRDDITIQYRKTSGSWLPERWRAPFYNGNDLLFTDNIHVEKLDLDPAVGDSDFQVEIKPEMIVEERTDLPTKHPLVNPESKISIYRAKEGGGREELPDPAHRKGDQYQQHVRRKQVWFWMWIVLPALAIGGFLVWVRRRRRRAT